MARNYARIGTSIWDDPEFTALPASAQRAYLFLLSQKDLALTGVIVRRSKWGRSGAGYSAADLEADLAVLVDAGFVVVDDDSDEVWIRTFMRHDGVLANSKLRRGALARLDAIHSPTLRALVTAQLDAAETTPPDHPPDHPPDALSDDLSDGACDGESDAPRSIIQQPETIPPSSQSDPPPGADPVDERLIEATWPLVAEMNLDTAQFAGAVIRSPTRWLATAERNARTEHDARARQLAAAWQIPNPRTLAELITGRRTLATSHLPRRTPGAA